MRSRIGEIECLFCDDSISFYDGERGIIQSHLELRHEVEEAKKDLVIAFCFLKENELQELVSKVQPRKEYFLEHGEEEEIDDELDEEQDEKFDEKFMNYEMLDVTIVDYEENDLSVDITNNETAKIPNLDLDRTKKFQQMRKYTPGIYSCNQCESKYSAQSSLKRHQTLVHEGLKETYSCVHCEYFAPRDKLSRHVRSVHKAIIYFCKVCDYQTRDQNNLRKHRLSKHDGVRYFCDQCEFSAGWKRGVVRHKKRKHSIGE